MTDNTTHVGWDIGIKNLAHCLVTKLDPARIDPLLDNIITLGTNKYYINPATWDIIDFSKGAGDRVIDRGEVMLSQRPPVTCCANLERLVNGQPVICNKKANTCLLGNVTPGQYKGYCATHFKKQTQGNGGLAPPGLDPVTYVQIKPTSSTCCALLPGGEGNRGQLCKGRALYMDRAHMYTGYCKKHYNALVISKPPAVPTRTTAEFLKIVKSKSVTSLDLTLLAESLYEELDKRPALIQVTQVLLENQPVLKNPTMKTMQSLLYGYYVIRARVDKRGPARQNNTIQCYCASNKLDLIKFLAQEHRARIKIELDKLSDPYAKNKALAIMLVNYYLEHSGHNVQALKSKFAACPKQDDMADSLLMTLHALEKANLAKVKGVDVTSVGLAGKKKKVVPVPALPGVTGTPALPGVTGTVYTF